MKSNIIIAIREEEEEEDGLVHLDRAVDLPDEGVRRQKTNGTYRLELFERRRRRETNLSLGRT